MRSSYEYSSSYYRDFLLKIVKYFKRLNKKKNISLLRTYYYYRIIDKKIMLKFEVQEY